MDGLAGDELYAGDLVCYRDHSWDAAHGRRVRVDHRQRAGAFPSSPWAWENSTHND